jgi:hypothetical protein
MGKKFSHSIEAKAKISEASLLRWQDPIYRLKMSKRKGRKGLPAPWARERNWKGDEASYFAKHQYAARHFGKASKCSFYPEWANISGKYERERTDWIELCPKCHWKFDHPNGLILSQDTKNKIGVGLKLAYAEGRRKNYSRITLD